MISSVRECNERGGSMKLVSETELESRIHSFMDKKLRKYPDLKQ